MEGVGQGRVPTLGIAATYIGTVIGAGFASGQEILQFFAVFGVQGLYGLLIASVLFAVFGYLAMELGYRVRSRSYIEVLKLAGGRVFGLASDVLISFFLFGTLATMIAASGALFHQQLGLSGSWGSLLITLATVLTLFNGFRGVIKSLSVIAPVLLAVTITISLISIISGLQEGKAPGATGGSSPLVAYWAWSPVLYVSYNLVTCIAILAPLGNQAKDLASIRKGALLAGLGLGTCAAAIFCAVSVNLDSLSGVELPMAYLAGKTVYGARQVYAVILMTAIYATSVGCFYGFVARFEDREGKRNRLLVAAVALLAFLSSRFGFTNLVAYLYPMEGYVGIALLLGLVFGRRRVASRKPSL